MAGRVLLIEDEPHIAEAIRFILSRDGWEVEVLSDGGKALAAVAMDTPDLLILDLMLPGMSGLEILVALRSIMRGKVYRGAHMQSGNTVLTSKDDAMGRVASLSVRRRVVSRFTVACRNTMLSVPPVAPENSALGARTTSMRSINSGGSWSMGSCVRLPPTRWPSMSNCVAPRSMPRMRISTLPSAEGVTCTPGISRPAATAPIVQRRTGLRRARKGGRWAKASKPGSPGDRIGGAGGGTMTGGGGGTGSAAIGASNASALASSWVGTGAGSSGSAGF